MTSIALFIVKTGDVFVIPVLVSKPVGLMKTSMSFLVEVSLDKNMVAT